MEIEQRVRGAVLAQVHALGGNLVRIGEELQDMARRPVLLAAAEAPSLIGGFEIFPAEAASSAEVYAAPAEAAVTEGAPVSTDAEAAPADAETDAAAASPEAEAAPTESAPAVPETGPASPPKTLGRRSKKSRRK